MHPIMFNDFSDSPTLLLPSQHLSFPAASSYAHSCPYYTYKPIMPPTTPVSASNRMPPSVSPKTPTSSSKKRQRESSPCKTSPRTSLDDNGDIDMHMPPSRTPAISPEPMHGQEMPVINPMTGQQSSAETQSNSWFEATMKEKLGSGTGESSDEGDASKRSKRARLCEENFGNKDSSDKEIDFYTQKLGKSWTSVGDDEDTQAAVRGYCRFIEHHYPLTGVDFYARSTSLASFLVITHAGFYLFNDTLTEGRFLATDFPIAISSLQKGPSETMKISPIHAGYTTAASYVQGSKAQIDQFNRKLGAGWSTTWEDPEFHSTVSTFCEYIENCFPLKGVAFLAKCKSLQSFLVKANSGYFLFNEGLREGQLVARDFEITLERLQSLPRVFETGSRDSVLYTNRSILPDGTAVFGNGAPDVTEDVPMI